MVIKGIQQFQLRNELGSEEAARATLRAVKQAGFEGIELNSFMLQEMTFSIRLLCRLAGMPIGASGRLDWPRLLQEAQLKVISLHDNLSSILNEPEKTIAMAQKFGTEFVVMTGQQKFDYSDEEQVSNLVTQLNTAGELLATAGLNFLYHNHNAEFRKLPSGQTAYDYLIEQTNPQWVNFEFDSYWATEAGCDVVGLMHKLGTRLKLYHVTDRGTRISGKTKSILKSDCMELGTGNMDLVHLIEIAKKNGVASIILESHQNWLNKSAIDSLQLSALFMNKYV